MTHKSNTTSTGKSNRFATAISQLANSADEGKTPTPNRRQWRKRRFRRYSMQAA